MTDIAAGRAKPGAAGARTGSLVPLVIVGASLAGPSAAETLRAMEVLVATELVVAVRALRFAGREPSGAGVHDLFEAAAHAFPAGMEDRAFGRDVDVAMRLLWR